LLFFEQVIAYSFLCNISACEVMSYWLVQQYNYGYKLWVLSLLHCGLCGPERGQDVLRCLQNLCKYPVLWFLSPPCDWSLFGTSADEIMTVCYKAEAQWISGTRQNSLFMNFIAAI